MWSHQLGWHVFGSSAFLWIPLNNPTSLQTWFSMGFWIRRRINLNHSVNHKLKSFYLWLWDDLMFVFFLKNNLQKGLKYISGFKKTWFSQIVVYSESGNWPFPLLWGDSSNHRTAVPLWKSIKRNLLIGWNLAVLLFPVQEKPSSNFKSTSSAPVTCTQDSTLIFAFSHTGATNFLSWSH